MRLFSLRAFVPAVAALLVASVAVADEGKPINLGEALTMTAPAKWISKQPKIRFIEYEFEVPVAEGDEIPGRVTMMGASGGVEGNVKRWEGQFKSDNGGEVKADVKKLTVDDQEVHLVDLKGTYLDRPAGPFAGGAAVDREGYRMLGAIIQTKKGDYFVKLYGPEKTVGAAKPDFEKMIEGLKAK